jgi:predicted nuclease of restriction endonuclease-like RecB superfamily
MAKTTVKKIKKPKNKFENRILEQLKRHNLKFKYESEKIPYVIARHYIPDFVIDTPTGKVYIECKGYFRPEHKAKMAAVKKLHPELDIRLLFYSASKPNIRWATKHGFRYAFREIPQDWIDGL